jgi:hypothetical protein
MFLKRGDDARGIRDGPVIEPRTGSLPWPVARQTRIK